MTKLLRVGVLIWGLVTTCAAGGFRYELPLDLAAPPLHDMMCYPMLRTTFNVHAGEIRKPLSVIVDTGFSDTITFSTEGANALGLVKNPLYFVWPDGQEAFGSPAKNDAYIYLGMPIVGQVFLGQYCMTYDFQRGKMVVEPPRQKGDVPKSDANTWVIPYYSKIKGNPHSVVIKAVVNGLAGEYHVDTGYTWTWMDDGLAAQAGVGKRGTRENDHVEEIVPSVVLGDVDVSPYFRRVWVKPSTPSHQSMRWTRSVFGDLGLSFLRKFIVTLDPVNQVLIFKPWKKPSADAAPPDLGVKVTPGKTVPAGTGVFLTTVTPDGSAAKAGLQEGDEILSFGGLPTTWWASFAHEIQQFYDTGVTVPVTYRRLGEVKTVPVMLQSIPAPITPPLPADSQ